MKSTLFPVVQMQYHDSIIVQEYYCWIFVFTNFTPIYTP